MFTFTKRFTIVATLVAIFLLFAVPAFAETPAQAAPPTGDPTYNFCVSVAQMAPDPAKAQAVCDALFGAPTVATSGPITGTATTTDTLTTEQPDIAGGETAVWDWEQGLITPTVTMPPDYMQLFSATNFVTDTNAVGFSLIYAGTDGMVQNPHPGTLDAAARGDSLEFSLYSGDVDATWPALNISGYGTVDVTHSTGYTETMTLGAVKYPLAFDPGDTVTFTMQANSFMVVDVVDASTWQVEGVAGAAAPQDLRWPAYDIPTEPALWENDQFSEGVWATGDYKTNYSGANLGLPNGGRGWVVNQLAQLGMEGESTPWHLAFGQNKFRIARDSIFINCGHTQFCGRGKVAFTMTGTAEQYRVYGATATPAVGFTGQGTVKIDILNSRGRVEQSTCWVLGTGRPQLATDPGVIYRVTFNGDYMEMTHGVTSDVTSVEVRWPMAEQDVALCGAG